MDYFNYHNNTLHAEHVNVNAIAAEYGTPTYVYSRATIERHWHAFDQAAAQHPHVICYAVKANSNLAVLNVLAKLGSGFDIVSGGELARVIVAGGQPEKVVFSGVGKTEQEIAYALEVGIKCFNVESESELQRIEKVAQQRQQSAPISIRVNPDIDANTHPYISTGLKENKFGIDITQVMPLYQYAHESVWLNVQGVDFHIGSQLTEVEPFLAALDKVLTLIDTLQAQDIHISHLDVGGGLGVTYAQEAPPHPIGYAAAIVDKLQHRKDLTLIFEPGRAIMANAGILLTQVEFIKKGENKDFAIVDAAMNDLLRPALYSAWQNIIPVNDRDEANEESQATQLYDIVGPVCETGDFLGKDRYLNIQEGDLLAVRSAGAYGFTMSSNYNSRTRAAEVMVDNTNMHLVRARETLQDLWRGESILIE
ncbi:diaminopimelate decarboxylase [Flocculibacter collagenilyticus]|uniref:diaminopimelate decarboxylase n=1 Tax=Flocculibacter collagenilyticus TaxID=2744479 RepID=UPI0018F2E0F0|nr:diaminopimelate decarboxylase [Flocculibacter collagenilyticus]